MVPRAKSKQWKGDQKKKNWKKAKNNKRPNNTGNQPQNPKNRKNKLVIKFDNEDRKNYLKGFQKRKQERRKEAFDKMEGDLKTELKQIRSERRQMMKNMIYQDDPEGTEEEEAANTLQTTCGSAMVEISELDLTSKFHHPTKKVPVPQTDKKTEEGADSGDTGTDIPVYTKENLEDLGIHTKKDLKRSVRQSATRAVKASKLMQKKEARHAREQRAVQRKCSNARRKMKEKKMKQRGGKPREIPQW